ncbi:hypothetical protein HW273_10530 [Oribacterium sp. oral taxon 102]|uniref:hypothetical protein n=1 Tax=Oribacterium sp. oral taxon 102 TaxID=671214 RepID=UPI0015BFDC83|nr:hypothetical protein [Oribacterium sp. oral taxon 102]NWO22317.1 hypothetical protein [Oribacterium sp. oral taxon 102]
MRVLFRKFCALAFTLVLSGLLAVSAFAEEGRLRVEGLQDRNGRAISGMELSLYQVALREASGDFTVSSAFSPIVSAEQLSALQTLNAEQLRAFSLRLRNEERSRGIAALDRTISDREGRAAFGQTLPEGIYLLDYANWRYFSSNPSLFSVPAAAVGQDGTITVSYDIVLRGKVEDDTPSEPNRPNPPETSPTPPETVPTPPAEPEIPPVPQDPGNVLGALREPVRQAAQRVLGAVRGIATGDESRGAVFLLLTVCAGIGLSVWSVAFVRGKGKKKEKERE